MADLAAESVPPSGKRASDAPIATPPANYAASATAPAAETVPPVPAEEASAVEPAIHAEPPIHAEAATAAVGPSIAALLDSAMHTTTTATQAPLPAEIAEAADVPGAEVAMTGSLASSLGTHTVTVSPQPPEIGGARCCKSIA